MLIACTHGYRSPSLEFTRSHGHNPATTARLLEELAKDLAPGESIDETPRERAIRVRTEREKAAVKLSRQK